MHVFCNCLHLLCIFLDVPSTSSTFPKSALSCCNGKPSIPVSSIDCIRFASLGCSTIGFKVSPLCPNVFPRDFKMVATWWVLQLWGKWVLVASPSHNTYILFSRLAAASYGHSQGTGCLRMFTCWMWSFGLLTSSPKRIKSKRSKRCSCIWPGLLCKSTFQEPHCFVFAKDWPLCIQAPKKTPHPRSPRTASNTCWAASLVPALVTWWHNRVLFANYSNHQIFYHLWSSLCMWFPWIASANWESIVSHPALCLLPFALKITYFLDTRTIL